MHGINQPSKEEVREWLRERRAMHTPPPDSVQIRRELGWELARNANETEVSITHTDCLCNPLI